MMEEHGESETPHSQWPGIRAEKELKPENHIECQEPVKFQSHTSLVHPETSRNVFPHPLNDPLANQVATSP